MITQDSIEAAYCFFHQKWRVYEHSTIPSQQDDIEYAIAQYVEGMNQELYEQLANGNPQFLLDHLSFAHDMPLAIERLEGMLGTKEPPPKAKGLPTTDRPTGRRRR